MNLLRSITRLPVGPLLFGLASFVTRFKCIKSNVLHGQFYFADPDCYTRLYRAKLILSGGPWIQSWHSFENFPDGIPVHTTALLDWLLVVLTFFFKQLPLAGIPALDWAGFVVGPLVAAVAGMALYYLTRDFRPAWARWPLLLTYLFAPMLIWSTAAARPDHQCLIVSFLIIAWVLELRRWENPSLHLWAGIVWGLALWTSFLEPLLYLSIVFGVNLALRRREDRRFWIPALTVTLLTLVMEGFRWKAYCGISDSRVANWMAAIGELQHCDLKWWPQYGFAVFLIPLLLFLQRKHKYWQQPAILILLLSTAVSFALAVYQLRWSYFMTASSMFALFLIFQETPGAPVKWLILSLHFTPIMIWNIHEILMTEPPGAIVEVRQAAGQIRNSGQSVMAPWWLSPALLYYSDAPIIASSSHESIEGIVDSAKFYSTQSFPEAESLLEKHRVGWILVYYPEWVYRNSLQILTGRQFRKIESPDKARLRIVTVRLFEYIAVPAKYKIVFASRDMRLYHYEP